MEPDSETPRVPTDIREAPGVHSSQFMFPGGFLWGAATSAHQVEGDNRGNDWWAFEQAGKVPFSSGLACDHYHRFREDFDLARDLAHNAHRFSLEWSRIEPEEGRFSDEALDHYTQVIDALIERHIEPIVTIHHYTLPVWLSAQGGWDSGVIEDRFVRYVRRVVAEYGRKVKWWITINEPVVLVFKAYVIGQWPPAKTDYGAALRAMRHMMRAHVRAYHAIKETAPESRVGIAKHALAITPCNPDSTRDRLSAWARDYLFNQLFLDAIHTGALRVPGLFWERLPQGHALDFIGINYYTRDFVKNSGFDLPGLVGSVCTLDHHRLIGKRNSLGWEIYPEGLAQFLRMFQRFKLPILITENGIPTDYDEDRWLFLLLHIWQVARAIQEGVPVVGYLYWSLLDNFEWADGFDHAHFGLIGVDFKTLERTVRPSARRLADVIRHNEL